MANTTFSQETVLELKERIIDIQNTGELGFRNFTLCQNIITYGQYVPYPNNNVKAGSEIYFYYEPKICSQTGGTPHTRFGILRILSSGIVMEESC